VDELDAEPTVDLVAQAADVDLDDVGHAVVRGIPDVAQ
jgi:hypothetical protein